MTITDVVSLADIYAALGITSPTANETVIITNSLNFAFGAIKNFIRYDPLYGEHTEFHPQQNFQAVVGEGIWEIMEQRAVIRQVSEAATNEMQLQHLPVRGIISVRVDYDGRNEAKTGSFAAETLKTIGSDYWPNYDGYDSDGVKVCNDGVIKTLGLWPTTSGTIKVVYNAGYSADEFAGTKQPSAIGLKEAIYEETMRRVRRTILQQKGATGIPAGILTSENLGGYSYTLDAKSSERLWSGDLTPETKERLHCFVNWGFSLGS